MQKKAKHSKFKNAGILFELLTRQITCDILSGKDESFVKTLMVKYFHESKDLGKEVQLYNFIINHTFKNSDTAGRAIDVILQTRAKLNERELNTQKYNLIKEIKEKFNIDEFLKNKIPNYRLYASIYKLFENVTDESIKFDVTEIIDSKEYIIENFIRDRKKEDEPFDLYESQSSDVKLMAYTFLVENFNKKYCNLLPQQKLLLKEYITNISNTNKFTKFIGDEFKRVGDLLKESLKTVKSDVIKIKINEIIVQFNNKTPLTVVKENQLTSLMSAYELLVELSNVNNELKS